MDEVVFRVRQREGRGWVRSVEGDGSVIVTGVVEEAWSCPELSEASALAARLSKRGPLRWVPVEGPPGDGPAAWSGPVLTGPVR